MKIRNKLILLILITVILSGAFFVIIIKSYCQENPPDINKSKCRYAEFLSLGKGCVLFNAPFTGIKNDKTSTNRTELYAGDFIRFPQSEEAGEIITVKEIKDGYALIEYLYYSAPPAPRKQEKYDFKIYK